MSQDLQTLTSQFYLSTSTIRSACTAAIGQLTTQSTFSFKQALWENCRVQARPGLDKLAERIESKLTWEDLVLPPLQEHTLKQISAHVRQKAKVYENWGLQPRIDVDWVSQLYFLVLAEREKHLLLECLPMS